MATPRFHAAWGGWSLLDQALVSGSNFITGIILARALGPAGFGAYVIAQTYLLYANTFQSALVVSPMMTDLPAQADLSQQRNLLRGFFAYMLAVMTITVVAVQLLSAALGHGVQALDLKDLSAPLGAAMIAFQLQDWLRRAMYAQISNRSVFVVDVCAYGGQVFLVAALAWHDALTPAMALWILAASFGSSALLALLMVKVWPSLNSGASVLRTHWRSGLDFFASWQLQWVATSGVILIGSGFVGVQAAGAIKAVQNLLGPINVLFQWMDNVVPVRAAVRLRTGGVGALKTLLTPINRLGLIALTTFTLLLLAVDELLMTALYGAEYAPFAALVVYQALYYVFGHAYRVQSYLSRALGQTAVLAQASLFWAVASVTCALVVVEPWGERGIMVALVLGEVAALTYLLVWRRRHPIAPHGASTWLRLQLQGGRALLIPQVGSAATAGTLAMYAPSRWTGRLYRAVAPAWAWCGRRLGVLMPQGASPLLLTYLPVVVAAVEGAHRDRVGALLGPEAGAEKLTLNLMDERGQSLAYARLGQGRAAQMVQHEARVLQALAATAAAGRVPRLLAAGQGADGSAWLVESVIDGVVSPLTLSELHAKFVSLLIDGRRSVSWSERVDVLSQRVATLNHPSWGQILDAATHALMNVDDPGFPSCIEHGDFAPWNIRRNSNGLLCVIDWEGADLDGLPWLDLLHFRHQVSRLVLREPTPKVLQHLQSLFDDVEMATYARLCPVSEGWRRRLVLFYLMRALCADRERGLGPGDGIQRGRIDLIRLAGEGLWV